MSARLRVITAAVLMPATLFAVALPAVAAQAAVKPHSNTLPGSSDEAKSKPAGPGVLPPVVKTPVIKKKKPAPRKAPVSRYRQLPARVLRLNWHGLAACESGGRPNAVSSNGLYRGMYQFSVGTWHGVGGRGLPDKATKVEQTYRAQLLFMRSGTRP